MELHSEFSLSALRHGCIHVLYIFQISKRGTSIKEPQAQSPVALEF